MKGRSLVRIAVAVAVGGIAGISVYIAVAGLDKASEVAGLVVAFVELIALAIAVYGVTGERRADAGGQAIVGSSIGGDATQIRGVKGNLIVGNGAGPSGARAADPAGADPITRDESVQSPGGEQAVQDSRISGHLRQIIDVDGDVETD